MKHTDKLLDGEEDIWYGIHEYYIFENGVSYTETSLLEADTVEELKEILKMIEQDIYRHGVKDYD